LNKLLTLTIGAISGIVALASFVTGFAAGEGEGPVLPRDSELVEISPFAALLQATQEYRGVSACATADFFESVKLGDHQGGGRLLEELIGSTSSECAVYVLAERETAPVFLAIKEAGELPETPFVFGLFVYDPNLEGSYAGYAEETIGLFADIESCQRVERAARDRNLPTRRCEEWSDTALR
jgi:hypothetical protein